MKQIKMQLAVLLLLCTIITTASCNKEGKGPQLPPETQTGALTIGFKVDGKVYTAFGKYGPLSDGFVFYKFYLPDSLITINSSNTEQKFSFAAKIKFQGLNTISYCKTFPFEGSFQDDSNGTISNGSNQFKTSEQYQGRFTIKYFNPQSQPLSTLAGTFEMDAVNGQGKVIHITDGRFDIAH